jgi:hypothetical protein
MLAKDCIEVLDRILEATRDRRLIWHSDTELDFFAKIGKTGRTITITRLWMEVVGRPGADPYQVELSMPGWNVRFPIAGDSEGCRRVFAILEAATGDPFLSCQGSSAKDALKYLEENLPPVAKKARRTRRST